MRGKHERSLRAPNRGARSDNGAAVCGYGDLVNNSTANVDFAFMDAVKTDIENDQCLDTNHVFATGFSMGGYFTEHIGCYRSDFHGLAPHSGGTLADLSPCTTGPTPNPPRRGLARRIRNPRARGR